MDKQKRIKNLQGLAEGVQRYIDSPRYKGTDNPHILLNKINLRIENILNGGEDITSSIEDEIKDFLK